MNGRPSADQIAHAIVAAARACDEDPIAICHGAAGKARIYAFAAIKSLFPGALVIDLAGLFGAKVRATLVGQGTSAIRAKWWDEEVLARVKAAVPPVPAEPVRSSAPSFEPPVPDVAPKAAIPVRHELQSHWHVPPARKATRSDRVIPMPGEPEPGRSALDQRRAGRC